MQGDNALSDDFNDVQRSYGRCLAAGSFIDRFYDILMASNEDVRRSFARTDFGRQRRALRRGITTAILYAAGDDLVSRTVQTMAEVHSRKGRAPVEPALYGYWMESMIQAVREYDSAFDQQLEARWRRALQPVIDTFIDRY